MKNELIFTDEQIERLDLIDNTVYQTLLTLLEKTADKFPWDIEFIGAITEAISQICEEKGYHMRWPCITTDNYGRQTYEE